MSPLLEVQLVTWRELRHSFRSVKGMLLGVLSLGGGGAMAMLLAWADRVQRESVPSGVDLRYVREKFYERLYGEETARALVDCPYPLWVMLGATLWLAPLFVALMSFDSISGDLQHRTVRYWTVRVRRAPFVVGKALGTWAAVLAVTLGMNVVVWIFTASVGQIAAGEVLGWGLRFFAVSIPISAAWCGIAVLVGSFQRTPFLSLLLTCAVFFVIWLLWIIAGVSQVGALAYVYPNAYDRLLLSPGGADIAKGLLGPSAMAVATTAAAALVFQRRDV